MKKYFLGIAVGLIFVVYSTVLRHQHSEPVIAPASLSQNSSTTSIPSTTPSTSSTSPQFKDGTYTGRIENAYYGNVQVSAVIRTGY